MLVVEIAHWSVTAAGIDPATPAAVVSAGRVTAVTPAASDAGVATGMHRRQAQSRCPALEVVECDLDLDARRFAPVVAALEELTPRVEVLAPGCCVFGTRAPSRYYGGDETLAELVARTVTGALASDVLEVSPAVTPAAMPEVRVGIADGLFAAGLAARVAPGGVLVVPASASAGFLSQLSLRALTETFSPLAGTAGPRGVGASGTSGEELVDVLKRLGLRTLGDVAGLRSADLAGRFGTPGEWAHRLASGGGPRLSQPGVAAPGLCVDAEIDPPADRADTVAFTAKSLADHLDTELVRCGHALVCVQVSIETENSEISNRFWRHGFRFSPADVTDRVRWQLDGWRQDRNRPSGRISFIRLTVAQTVPDEGRQLGFWGGQTETDERAERALGRVQTLVGFDGVTVGRLGSGRRFADLEQRLPFGTAGAVSPVSPVSPASPMPPWPGRLGAPVPALVLFEPEPLVVLDADGEPVGVSGRGEASAPPAELRRANGRISRITAWAGPWLLDERWWVRGARRRQARFQLVLDDGTAHLCAVEGGRWQREATYD